MTNNEAQNAADFFKQSGRNVGAEAKKCKIFFGRAAVDNSLATAPKIFHEAPCFFGAARALAAALFLDKELHATNG